jgi:hypothetical protein
MSRGSVKRCLDHVSHGLARHIPYGIAKMDKSVSDTSRPRLGDELAM